jgi:hypothetical protein
VRRGWGWVGAVGAALSLGAGCAQGPCDFYSHGACVAFTYDVSALPDVQGRVDRLLEREMAYWGVHHISGWRIEFRDTDRYDCYLSLKNSGCTNYFNQEMSVYVGPSFLECFEAAPLLHELGHYTIGDPTHSDERWKPIPDRFAEMVWARPDAAPACARRFNGIATGMWPVHFDGF